MLPKLLTKVVQNTREMSSDGQNKNKTRFDKWFSTLTPAEVSYFKACTDIFYDGKYTVIGRPSLSTQLQNCVTFNLERSFSATDFGIASGSWDCNIVSLPHITSQVVKNVDDIGFGVGQPEVAEITQRWGGVTAWGVPAGAPTVNPGSATPISLNCDHFMFPNIDWGQTIPEVTRKFYEILSIGMEIWNTTPELYKGGSLVRYRVPTQGRRQSLLVTPTGYTFTPTDPRDEYYCYPMPPASVALATQFPDSIVTSASKGSYQMHSIQDQVSDFYLTGNDRVFYAPSTAPLKTSGNSWISASKINPAIDYDPPLVRGDFDMVGTYFHGLSFESTLTVRYRVIVSLVPNSSDANLVSLAKVSPDFNPRLDEMISQIQGEFPPGVDVSMNPKGEWFKKVVGFGAKVIPKVIPIATDALSGDYMGAAQKTLDAFKKDNKKLDSQVVKHDSELAALKRELSQIHSLLMQLQKLKATKVSS